MLYLGEFHTNKNRTKFITLELSFPIVGGILSNIMALVILPTDFKYRLFSDAVLTPWRVFILLNNTVGVMVLIALAFLPESPQFTLSKRKKAETLKTLQTIYHINSGKPVDVKHVSNFINHFFLLINILDISGCRH